ncbi:MAG: molybdate ABC transporter substrate-binding protein [Pseudolabrys sp.]|nr:molybdate ABC transporter substrate-binding protein [Pseudolabrys sp.]
MLHLFLAIIVSFLSVAFAAPASAQERLTVFAAASLRNALDTVNAAFSNANGVGVTASYEASSALARQIVQGAPADVFISADLAWMDYLAEHKLINADSRFNLLGNKLVLIAPKDSKFDKVEITKGFDIAKLAGQGRVAVADVKAVPAGRYAKAALEALGVWTAAETRLAQAENVRSTLAFVARGEAPIGIVYATDAMVEPKVKIIGTFPDGTYPPVVYPAAATIAGKPVALRYLQFLRSNAAKAVFEKYGFSVLTQPTPP